MLRKQGRFHKDMFVLVLLGLLAIAGPLLGQPNKFDRNKRVGFAAMIPANPGDWTQISSKSSEEMPDKLDINELYQVLYSHPSLGQVALTLEYTSDSRREFELHYPDVCHSIRGDDVVPHPPGRFALTDGRFIDAAMMNWKQRNGGYAAMTAYWYVTAEGVTTDSMKLKIKQAFSSLFSKPEEAVMVRFDAFYENNLSPQKLKDLFEAIKELSHNIESEIDPRASTMLYKHISKEEI